MQYLKDRGGGGYDRYHLGYVALNRASYAGERTDGGLQNGVIHFRHLRVNRLLDGKRYLFAVGAFKVGPLLTGVPPARPERSRLG